MIGLAGLEFDSFVSQTETSTDYSTSENVGK